MVTDSTSQADDTTAFLRAARSGNLEKVIEFLDTDLDINTANSNGLNALHLASKDGHLEIVTELLKRGAKVDAATKKGNTALHIASLAGQAEIVNILIQYGAAVNIQSQNGFTPLYMAAQENHDQVVKLLLSNGANQSLATEDGFTPLAVAMQQGHDKVVSVLLENDSKGKVRLPALHIAAKKDDCKAADLLLQNDHKPDVTSKSGFTPLHIAAHYGNEEIARLLIKRGADVNYLAKHNISPLHVAAKWGKNNMVKVLLENSAQIDAKTRDGLTPLHCAARSGHEQVITTLLEQSAPISARTKNGLAPLHMASQGDHVDAARVLLYHRAPVDEVTIDYLTSLHVAAHCGHVRVAKLLLDRKADPNARALNGFTPLHIACKKNRIKVVELLLKHGASIESTTESGLTPLHVASFMGCMNIVIFLLQHEANPDVPTVRGETPLHLAARANQTDIIRILLRNGAKVDARAREQQTPLHIASRLGNIDIVMLLLQHGAAVDTTTKDMYTALHIAAKEGQEEVATILVENNASLKATTKNGFTPLHIAAKYGNMSVAKILLQRDSKLDAQGKNDISPLHLACHYDHPNVANLLLEKGASPHLASQNGHTPLHIAARKNQMDIASTLLENGANANAESKAGFTPLHLSAQKGHYDMTNLLIEHGADPNHKSKNGLTALHLCAQEDFIKVASILVKNGANVESETETGYRPIHVAAHFGNLSMIRFLLKHNASIDVKTNQNYTPLHQAAQQGHAHIVTALLEGNASHKARTADGLTALNIAQKLGYISVMEVLKGLSYDTLAPDNKNWEEKYKVIAPESLQETSFMSDSDDEGGSDALISEQPYRYLTADLMKSLRDDSLPIDVTRDDPIHRQVTKEEKQDFTQSNNYCLAENFDTDGFNLGFLVSFLVDARGGAMKGCRHSGVRIIVPPRRATMPIRVTCRLIKPNKVANPPPLMEGEALATRIIEMGPIGATFLGPVLIDIPHFASIRGKEREIIILRSENGETWKEHDNSADNDTTLLNTPYDPQMSAAHSGRITRIITTDFPQYFAIITRIKQEVHVIGAEGGILTSSVANDVQAVFPPGALTKKIKVGLQAHVIPAELTAKLLGNCVAVSPVITIEPRRRKFHKPITLTIPVPQAANKGMINQYGGETPTLRLLCSIAGGTSESQWEDVTGSTPLTFMNDTVSFTTTVSARFWLMDCRNIGAVPKMATELYEESLFVPYITNFVIYSKRMDMLEATLRILCMTDGKEGMHTLERQEEFVEIVKSRDVEALDGKDLYIEFSGNLVPVTKSGVQLKFTFKAFRQNRLSFHVKVKDPLLDPVARMLFMREPKVAKGEPPQQPICVLNIVLPEITTKIEVQKKLKDYEDSNIIKQKLESYESKYKMEQKEKSDEPKDTSPSEKKFITDTLQKERTDAVTIHEFLAQKAACSLESVDASYPSKVVGQEVQDLSPVERQTYSEKRKFWEDISRKRESYQRSESEVSRTSQLTVNESDNSDVQNLVTEDTTDMVQEIEKSETMDDLNVPDISECSVAEKAQYFEEQIQRETTKHPTKLYQQDPVKSEKEKSLKGKTSETEKIDKEEKGVTELKETKQTEEQEDIEVSKDVERKETKISEDEKEKDESKIQKELVVTKELIKGREEYSEKVEKFTEKVEELKLRKDIEPRVEKVEIAIKKEVEQIEKTIDVKATQEIKKEPCKEEKLVKESSPTLAKEKLDELKEERLAQQEDKTVVIEKRDISKVPVKDTIKDIVIEKSITELSAQEIEERKDRQDIQEQISVQQEIIEKVAGEAQIKVEESIIPEGKIKEELLKKEEEILKSSTVEEKKVEKPALQLSTEVETIREKELDEPVEKKAAKEQISKVSQEKPETVTQSLEKKQKEETTVVTQITVQQEIVKESVVKKKVVEPEKEVSIQDKVVEDIEVQNEKEGIATKVTAKEAKVEQEEKQEQIQEAVKEEIVKDEKQEKVQEVAKQEIVKEKKQEKVQEVAKQEIVKEKKQEKIQEPTKEEILREEEQKQIQEAAKQETVKEEKQEKVEETVKVEIITQQKQDQIQKAAKEEIVKEEKQEKVQEIAKQQIAKDEKQEKVQETVKVEIITQQKQDQIQKAAKEEIVKEEKQEKVQEIAKQQIAKEEKQETVQEIGKQEIVKGEEQEKVEEIAKQETLKEEKQENVQDAAKEKVIQEEKHEKVEEAPREEIVKEEKQDKAQEAVTEKLIKEEMQEVVQEIVKEEIIKGEEQKKVEETAKSEAVKEEKHEEVQDAAKVEPIKEEIHEKVKEAVKKESVPKEKQEKAQEPGREETVREEKQEKLQKAAEEEIITEAKQEMLQEVAKEEIIKEEKHGMVQEFAKEETLQEEVQEKVQEFAKEEIVKEEIQEKVQEFAKEEIIRGEEQEQIQEFAKKGTVKEEKPEKVQEVGKVEIVKEEKPKQVQEVEKVEIIRGEEQEQIQEFAKKGTVKEEKTEKVQEVGKVEIVKEEKPKQVEEVEKMEIAKGEKQEKIQEVEKAEIVKEKVQQDVQEAPPNDEIIEKDIPKKVQEAATQEGVKEGKREALQVTQQESIKDIKESVKESISAEEVEKAIKEALATETRLEQKVTTEAKEQKVQESVPKPCDIVKQVEKEVQESTVIHPMVRSETPDIKRADIIKEKSSGRRIITEETTIIYKVQKDGSLVQEQVLKSVQVEGDAIGRIPETTVETKIFEKSITEDEIPEDIKREMQKFLEGRTVIEEVAPSEELKLPISEPITKEEKREEETEEASSDRKPASEAEPKHAKKEFESRIPISTAKKEAKPKTTIEVKQLPSKFESEKELDDQDISPTTRKKEFESRIPKRVIDTKSTSEKPPSVKKDISYTITEKKSSEEVTSKLEEMTKKSETQTFSKAFGDPQEAFKKWDGTKDEFATVTSKIDHKTSTMLEKKEVVSSEISSGTDKVITLEEKERVEKKKSSESQLKKESPTETLEEKRSKHEELDKTAIQKMSLNLTDTQEIIDAAAMESRAETKKEEMFKRLSDKEGVTTHKAGSSVLRESDADVAIRIKKDISERDEDKDGVETVEGTPTRLSKSADMDIETLAQGESHKETKESFDVKQFVPSKKAKEEDEPKQEKEEESPPESLEEKQRQKFKQIEARTIAETLIQSIESEIEAKSAADLKAKLLSKGYLEQIISEVETDHEKLADDLTRKFESIMRKSIDQDKSRTRSSIQEEYQDKSSARDSISVSEDITKDEESSPHEKEESYPLSSSQAKLQDRDITMSPSSISEQIDFEETIDVDTNELESMSKPTLSPQSEKQQSKSSSQLPREFQSDVSFPEKIVSEISGARVLEILEPMDNSQSREDSVDVPSLEMDEHKISEQTSRGIPSLHESADIDSFDRLVHERDITISPSTVSEDTNIDYSLVQETSAQKELVITKRADSFEIESPPLVSPKPKIRGLEIKPVNWMIGDEKIEISETLQPSQIFNQELEAYESMQKKKERLSSLDGSTDHEQESGTKSSDDVSVIESAKETDSQKSKTSKFTVIPVTEPDFESELVENKLEISCQELVDTLQREYDAKTPIKEYVESIQKISSEVSSESAEEKPKEEEKILQVEEFVSKDSTTTSSGGIQETKEEVKDIKTQESVPKAEVELKLEKTTKSEKGNGAEVSEADKGVRVDDVLKEWTETYLSKMKPSSEDYKRHMEKATEKHDKSSSGRSTTVPSDTCAFKIKKDDHPSVDLSARYAITVLDQVVKKEIAEVKESLEAAKQDLIEELSENSETVIQIKDSPSEFRFKLQPESIPNDLPFLYTPSFPEQEAEPIKSESPVDKSAPCEEKDTAESKEVEESSSSIEEPVRKAPKTPTGEPPIIKTEKSDLTVQEDIKDDEEDHPSPLPASRSGSDIDNKDESSSLALPRPVLRRRQKPGGRSSKRVTSESDDLGSSSGESSNYQSCDYESSSRPSSSDVEAMHSCGVPSATASEYETAMMSIEHSSSSKPTSQEYHTAATTMSSRESMKSLTSLSSGHLGSIDSTSELSETLVPSEADDKEEAEENGVEEENTEQSDSSGSEIPIDEPMDKIYSSIPCRMKRSSEMIFPQVLEAAALDTQEPTDSKGIDSATSTVTTATGALQSVDIMTSRVSEDGVQSVCTQVISTAAGSDLPAQQVESEDTETVEKDMIESEIEQKASIEVTSEVTSESPEMSAQISIPSMMQQASMSTSSTSGVSIDTVIEKEKSDRHSPDSDSFEMVDKPDIIDDFVVIEEVGREAEEYDSEGKSIRISAIPQVTSKQYDRDLENLIAENKEDAQVSTSQAKTSELFEFESEESPPQISNEDQYSQSYSDEDEGGKKWIEMQFHADTRVYDMEYDRGPLEDIKEEEITDFEAGSSRFGSLGSHKESIGSVGSMRGSLGSTPDYDVLAGKKYFTRPSDHDNVSLSSLQEFEHLESAVAAENSRKLQCGSHDSVNNGSLPRRYISSRSGHGDDISLSSLKDFEGLEKACREAHLIELRAREEEDLLEHESPENKYKLENLPRTRVDTSTAGSFNASTSGSDDYEKRIKEIDEIIRIAQSNVEKFDRQDDTTEDISQIEITDAEKTGVQVQSVSKLEEPEVVLPQRESNVMETSTDSLELEDNMDKKHHPLCRSSDSLEMKTTLDFPSLSSDSLNNVRDAKEAQSDVAEIASSVRRISSDSLDMPLLEQQDEAREKPSNEDDHSDGVTSDNSLEQRSETTGNERSDRMRTPPSTNT